MVTTAVWLLKAFVPASCPGLFAPYSCAILLEAQSYLHRSHLCCWLHHHLVNARLQSLSYTSMERSGRLHFDDFGKQAQAAQDPQQTRSI